MTGYELMSLAFFIAALMVCITSLMFTLIQQRTGKNHNRIYILTVSIVAFNSLCTIVESCVRYTGVNSASEFTAMQICVYLYFITHITLGPLFYFYVSYLSGSGFLPTKGRKILNFTILGIMEFLVITNPYTGWVYYYTDSREFTRSFAEYIIYGFTAVYLLLAIVKLFRTWNALTAKRRTAVTYFVIVVVAGVILQLYSEKVSVELFAEAIGLMGVLMSLENEDELIDADSDMYNRRALRTDIKGYLLNKRSVSVIGIRITNADFVVKTSVTGNSEVITEITSDYLRSLVPRYYLYTVNPNTIAIAVPDLREQKALELCTTLSKRFARPWFHHGTHYQLDTVILEASAPKRLRSASDALYMLDSPLPADNDKAILHGSDLEYLLRRAAVEEAVSRGLIENSFEVYFQPTFCMKTKKLHGAEALLRMHDRELGSISPEEFIPIAEQMGLIDDIDDFVLREVCRFVKSGLPAACGMESINVNLSVLQCMKPNFVEHINAIVEESGIEKSFLNFEITESVAADDYLLLSRVVADLKKEGFMFSMDDYGTGYSNMNAILSLNLDVIKIDKSILRGAESSELGYIMLEYSVRMFRQMKRQILIEGVETAEQIELLSKLNVDYLQGYFFSKPLCEKEFVDFIKVPQR